MARSPNQAAYLRALDRHDLVFALGPAGTGKTYLAVAMAVALLKQRRIERIILSRPAVEAGERLGFLPGDLKEKVDPYMRPLYDALQDMLPEGKLQQRIEAGQIEIAPLAYMRGRTLSSAYVILDEAQNTTPSQMKMFLTRLGENSRMIITGDPTQTDLPPGMPSGPRRCGAQAGWSSGRGRGSVRQEGRRAAPARRRDHRSLRDGGAAGRPTQRGDATGPAWGRGRFGTWTATVAILSRWRWRPRHGTPPSPTPSSSAGVPWPPSWPGRPTTRSR